MLNWFKRLIRTSSDIRDALSFGESVNQDSRIDRLEVIVEDMRKQVNRMEQKVYRSARKDGEDQEAEPAATPQPFDWRNIRPGDTVPGL